jgi:hypothetical protein
MKTLKVILLCLLFTSSISARPKYLGRILTNLSIQSSFSQYKVTKGEINTYSSNAIFSSGAITFYDSGTFYELQTDNEGKVYSECLLFAPKTIVENNSLINLYKAEGQVISDQSSESYRSVALYLVKSENRVISSDIVSSWLQNSLGRVWDFNTRITYILTER